MKYLKQKGLSNAFIGKFCEQYYGVSRSAAYRYISPNKKWYDTQNRKVLLGRIQKMLCQGYTSAQIADFMETPLSKINSIIVQNKISVYKCHE